MRKHEQDPQQAVKGRLSKATSLLIYRMLSPHLPALASRSFISLAIGMLDTFCEGKKGRWGFASDDKQAT